MRRGDTLERVGDEIPRAPLRLRSSFLLHLAHLARELVADQVLRALQQVLLGLCDRHAGQPLELADLALLRLLQLPMERLGCLLAVREPLLASRELEEPALELLVARLQPLLGARDLATSLLHLRLDLRAETDRLFARLDLRLPAHGLGLSLGVLQQLLPRA